MTIALAGCAATLPDRRVVPEQLVLAAQPTGLSGVRAWGDDPVATVDRFHQIEISSIRAKYLERRRRGLPLHSNILALTGGADNGAFGAGLLIGWSEHGDRPEFDLVTGVSAGALISAFAFLGHEYDRQLSEIFTKYGSDQIFESNILPGLLGGVAIASIDPLKALIERYVDTAMMRRIAEERAKGRLLLIGTTNIDAERPVYWDAGLIARAGTPQALETLRKVLLASVSIPGVFPPVRITVEANGKTYDELHVDGGTTRQVFLSPSEFSFRELDAAIGMKISRKLFVIVNGKIGPEWQETKESTFVIGQRSLSTVLKSQTIGDLVRMHSKARADGIDYNLAVVPDSFKAAHPKPFDQTYMKLLFKQGYDLGRSGYSWSKSPPGVIAERKR